MDAGIWTELRQYKMSVPMLLHGMLNSDNHSPMRQHEPARMVDANQRRPLLDDGLR